MRFKVVKTITAFLIILNFISVFFIWKFFALHGKSSKGDNKLPDLENKIKSFVPATKSPEHINRVQSEITFVMRSFEPFDHDIIETVYSLLSIYPRVNILIITDTPFYPPIILNKTNASTVKFVSTKPNLTGSLKDRTPILHIETRYTFFIPDSTRLNNKKIAEKLIDISLKNDTIVAIPYKTKELKCLKIHLDIREWFIRFDSSQLTKECDFVKGKHALFLESKLLYRVTDPFMLPFPDSLFIQLSSMSVKVRKVLTWRIKHISHG